ncbi:hypothetical protein SARC_03437 [Sphaeroforma arctica JP610]|uniref:Uncharacterized protein n=1 Tax=Sphaeroforma arctica JP610 TaxID=667725 RepID=A0A0L0G5P8_9EUKA|nr:hypothetical protein SARC_03437 [Sphaeroforma arctica JP610]KNC84357.1 hypothetical protein SARC_03437 [Sphaeroforma arctica JP610]|eukprot:XP_014158259.1 hypothetical protein SARC_03437 [Sphaeroforma arctica JP610]
MNLERMQSAGIDPSTGLPMDSRAVTFESLRNTNNNIQQSSRRGGDILRRSDNWKKKFMAIANRIGLSPQKLVAVTVVTLVLYFLLRHTDLIFPDYVDDTGILNNTEE